MRKRHLQDTCRARERCEAVSNICHRCRREIPASEPTSADFTDDDDNVLCRSCCEEIDKEQMLDREKIRVRLHPMQVRWDFGPSR